jgi:hypothetical protein
VPHPSRIFSREGGEFDFYLAAGSLVNPFRYNGREFDAEIGRYFHRAPLFGYQYWKVHQRRPYWICGRYKYLCLFFGGTDDNQGR